MSEISHIKSNKPTSFHSIALNLTYVLILTACHFSFPYIHELVFSFFNGLFLILSIFLFFYLNAVFRTSSISHFSYSSLFFRIIISVLILSLSIIFIAFATNTIEIIQRFEFIRFLLFLFSFSLLAMIVAKYLYSLIQPKEKTKFVVLTDKIEELNLESLYSFEDNIKRVKQFHITEIESMLTYAIEEGVASVYISIDSKNLNNLEDLVNDLSKYAFNLFWILPNTFFKENALLNFTKPILLNGSPVSLDTNQYLLKRSLDVVGACFILISLSLLLVLVAGLIKISDRGPIFYRQLRHGQYGKEFNMLKFRSMAVGSDYTDQQVTHDDLRVTTIGKIIRKTSFDEIPQLLNVLKGEMSIVGPRPHIVSETDIYSKKIIHFLSRHQVKPGLTGLAQIRTRGKTSSVEHMQIKLESDLEYINQWSIYLDIKILLSTPLSIWENRHTNI